MADDDVRQRGRRGDSDTQGFAKGFLGGKSLGQKASRIACLRKLFQFRYSQQFFQSALAVTFE